MDALIEEFLSWLRVHKAGRVYLFEKMPERYDWGYIKACEVIEAELKRLVEEHRDDSDRIAGIEELLE